MNDSFFLHRKYNTHFLYLECTKFIIVETGRKRKMKKEEETERKRGKEKRRKCKWINVDSESKRKEDILMIILKSPTIANAKGGSLD